MYGSNLCGKNQGKFLKANLEGEFSKGDLEIDISCL